MTTTRSGLPFFRKAWAKRIASFTPPEVSAGRRFRPASLSRLLSAVKGTIRRVSEPTPMSIIFRSAGKASTKERNSRRAASKRVPAGPLAFILAVRSMTTTVSPAGAPKWSSDGSASAAISRIAASNCKIKSRFLRRSQPSRVASGRSFNTRSQIKSAVVLTFNPLGLRLWRNSIRGTAPKITNSADGTLQSMVQVTLLTWRSDFSTNSSKGTRVVVRR